MSSFATGGTFTPAGSSGGDTPASAAVELVAGAPLPESNMLFSPEVQPGCALAPISVPLLSPWPSESSPSIWLIALAIEVPPSNNADVFAVRIDRAGTRPVTDLATTCIVVSLRGFVDALPRG